MRFAPHPADLWRVTAADFIARTAYQIGKTPLLPIYAAMLGASDLLIGMIVSVSTMTGLMLKPLFGLLSDRMGRRLWLLIGLCVFAGAPFLYRFVETPEHLFALRLLHGTATAIFGPVGFAYVAEMGAAGRGERLGLFGMARSGGHMLAPTIGAALLLHFRPEEVFTIIGFLSLAAILPVAALTERPRAPRLPFASQIRRAFAAIRVSRAFWVAATLEGATHVATYGLKAFLPVYALTAAGYDLLTVGFFFTAQELAHIAARPFGGRLADRIGAGAAISGGLALLSASLVALGALGPAAPLILIALGVGLAMGLILPATLSLLSHDLGEAHLGAGMGALGALRNLGKVIGPAAAGLILTVTSYQGLFLITGGFAAAVALAVLAAAVRRQTA